MSKSSSGTQKSSSPRPLLFFVLYFSARLGFSSPKLSAHGTPFTRTKKIGTVRQIFGTVPKNPCRDYLRKVVSAPLKFWALVPHCIWDRYVYTSKSGSAVP